MRTSIRLSLLAATLIFPAAGAAQSAPTAYLNLTAESKLWVEGTSTVRGFSCRAADVDATVQAATSGAAAAVIAGEKAIRSVTVELPARGLDCGNGQMNEHMRKAIKADAAPTIRFQLASYDLTPGANNATVRLNGRLNLGGTEKAITLQAQAVEGPGGTLRVTGTHPLLLSEFGLKAPTLMMGTMKVGDRVQVKYDLILRP